MIFLSFLKFTFFIASLNPIAFGSNHTELCNAYLTEFLDISSPTKLPLLNDLGVKALTKKGQEKLLPQIKGIYSTGIEVRRNHLKIGYLGKTLNGRYMLLQPIGRNLNIEVSRALQVNQMAKKDLAIPYWGMAKLKGQHYWIRPLRPGHPLTSDFRQSSNVLARQIDDLRALRNELISIDKNFYESVLYTPQLLEDQSLNYSTFKLTKSDLREWKKYLNEEALVSTSDGHLVLETPPLHHSVSDGYALGPAPENVAWPMNRWTYYFLALFIKMSEDERNKAIEKLKSAKDRDDVIFGVQTLTDIQVLLRILGRSPEWKGPTVEFNKTVSFISDAERPFIRPINLEFKNNSKLVYHAKKHGAKFGLENPEEYLASAKAFILSEPGGSLEYYIREDGNIVLIDQTSNTFAIFSSSGLLLTYMRPSKLFNGYSSDIYYFVEQILKDNSFF